MDAFIDKTDCSLYLVMALMSYKAARDAYASDGQQCNVVPYIRELNQT